MSCLLFALYSGITLDGLVGTYRLLRIEHRLALCKIRTLPVVVSLWFQCSEDYPLGHAYRIYVPTHSAISLAHNYIFTIFINLLLPEIYTVGKLPFHLCFFHLLTLIYVCLGLPSSDQEAETSLAIFRQQ